MKISELLRTARTVFAPVAVAEFFHRDQDQLVSARGTEVLRNPALKARVNEQIAAWEEACKRGEVSGPIVVELGARAGSPLYLRPSVVLGAEDAASIPGAGTST